VQPPPLGAAAPLRAPPARGTSADHHSSGPPSRFLHMRSPVLKLRLATAPGRSRRHRELHRTGDRDAIRRRLPSSGRIAAARFIGLITRRRLWLGFAAGSASTATAAPAWAYGGAFGAGNVIGFLVTILILIVLFRLIALAFFGHHRRAWARHGYWGHGYWGADGDADRGEPAAGTAGREAGRAAGPAAGTEASGARSGRLPSTTSTAARTARTRPQPAKAPSRPRASGARTVERRRRSHPL